jgi:hypothetical protein
MGRLIQKVMVIDGMCFMQQNMRDSSYLKFLAISSQRQSISLSNKQYPDILYLSSLKMIKIWIKVLSFIQSKRIGD